MWIFSFALILQISGLFASYEGKQGKRRVTCGAQLAGRGGTGHSTGAEVSTIEQAWAVAFLIDDGSGNRIHCSGSIIDPTHIITAAHCFFPKDGGVIDTNKLTVVVGSNDPFGEKRRERGTQHKIKSFKVHDKYDSDTRAAYYDIAIVKVTKKIRFKDNVWPICIPERVDTNQNKFKKQTVDVIGYGPMRGDDDKDRTALTRLGLTARSKRFCNKKYTLQTTDANYFVIEQSLPNKFNNPSIFCAQNAGASDGTCGGDSGGPIVQFETEAYKTPRWVQIAAVHGSAASCDGSRFPSIFVRLDEPNILKWIYQMVFPDKLDQLDKCDPDYDYDCGDDSPPPQPSTTSRPKIRTTRRPSRPKTPSGGGKSNGPITENGCTYTCESNKSCRVKSSGSGAGSCFPPDFGGSCIGTPRNCKDCNKVVDCELGASAPQAEVADTCEYDCEPSGRCSVTFATTKQGGTKGVRKGSCFPEDFGGECTSTPTKCVQCKFKCLNRNGDKFKEEV